MEKKETIIMANEAYLYSLWSGVFKEYKGSILDVRHHDGIARFASATKHISCATEEGVVYNAIVWLSESNEKLASEILIKYEELQIEKLSEKIDNHTNKIKRIKEGIIADGSVSIEELHCLMECKDAK